MASTPAAGIPGGRGFAEDRAKMNKATLLGWTVIEVTLSASNPARCALGCLPTSTRTQTRGLQVAAKSNPQGVESLMAYHLSDEGGDSGAAGTLLHHSGQQ